MNQLLEWLPLLVFFIGFKLLDIYWATAALMAACLLVLFAHRARSGRFKPMHVVTAGVAVVLGTATLVLHDKRFILWKPTVLLGLTALVFLVSAVFGKRPMARRMFESVFSEPLAVSRPTWTLINIAWAFWFALLAAANLYIAWNMPEKVWVNFKVFGITLAMLVFMLPQVLWLSGRVKSSTSSERG